MLSSQYTLSCIVSTLRPRLEGLRIQSLFTQEKDQLILMTRDPVEYLQFSCERSFNTFYLRPGFARAKKNTLDVLSLCIDKRIHVISLSPVDRIVTFSIDAGLQLEARFFGQKANVVVVDDSGIIIDSFKDPKVLRGSRSETERVVPAQRPLQDLLLASPNATIKAVLKIAQPLWDSVLLREALSRAAIHPTAVSVSLEREHTESLQASVSEILEQLKSAAPRIYFRQGLVPAAFSLIPLEHLKDLEEEIYDDINEAVDAFIAGSKSAESREHRRATVGDRLDSLKEKTSRSIAALEKDLSASNRAQEYEQMGSLILSHLSMLAKGLHTFDAEDNGSRVTIPLSPQLTPTQNAQSYFERGKKSRHARDRSVARLDELKRKLSVLEQLLDSLPENTTKDDLARFMDTHRREFEVIGMGKREQIQEQLPFRVFVVDGGFEVWAGKNSKSNDLLTMRHAKPNDLWFHARGSSGSHVILRVATAQGKPGKKARTQAAGVAAYFSKMKNARLVPVAMTEKKYVRKPKGASAGTVVLEREDVIFAEPKLPGLQPPPNNHQ